MKKQLKKIALICSMTLAINLFPVENALAENIAKEVLEKFDLVKGIMVRVKKPEAPVNGIYDYFGVEIRRSKYE